MCIVHITVCRLSSGGHMGRVKGGGGGGGGHVGDLGEQINNFTWN